MEDPEKSDMISWVDYGGLIIRGAPPSFLPVALSRQDFVVLSTKGSKSVSPLLDSELGLLACPLPPAMASEMGGNAGYTKTGTVQQLFFLKH